MRCKCCRDKFEVKYKFQKYCMLKDDCIAEHLEVIRDKQKNQRYKTWTKKSNKQKEKLKTNKDYLKELQVVFNKFIRLRDKDLVCISCQKPAKYSHCGHYQSAGGNPELRFNEDNCNKQCAHCNVFLHGNLINYRVNLIKKIGIERVEFLETAQPLKKYTTFELKELKIVYRDKAKKL